MNDLTTPSAAGRERIKHTFDALKLNHQVALIPYLMAGFPKPEMTVALMHAAVQSGANVIELGVPFSDPMADGPVIQKAGDRALALGVGLAFALVWSRAETAMRLRPSTPRSSARANGNPIAPSPAIATVMVIPRPPFPAERGPTAPRSDRRAC